jgi:3-deoxy-D-manno-octulosonic acid (KDO) 8-phosphate synthase
MPAIVLEHATIGDPNKSGLFLIAGPYVIESADTAFATAASLATLAGTLWLPVLSDVHSVAKVERAAQVLDILQIPAFLCRQTDLVMAAAATGRPVNVKKGQFLSPTELAHVAANIRADGNDGVILTEREGPPSAIRIW